MHERNRRMRRLVAASLLLAAACGCGFGIGYEGDRGPPAPPTEPTPPRVTPAPETAAPEGCVSPGLGWLAAQRLYAETEASMHELVTCGGAQVRVAQSLLAIVLASNRALFPAADYERLVREASRFGLDLTMPFSPTGDGHWRMPIARRPGSHFDVAFFRREGTCADGMHADDPACGLIREDPFQLESYLVGLVVTSSVDLDTLLARPSQRTVLTFDWQERGPLADLLGDGVALADPFEVRVSLEDVVTLALGGMLPDEGTSAGPDFGPLRALLEVGMQSCVELFDRRGTANIGYHVDAERETLAALARVGELGWRVEYVEADDGETFLTGSAAELGFVRLGALNGFIEYDVSAPGVSAIARSDFGLGAAYPTTSWRCP